jgi:glycosyltransferase involved in cell wall biosynthesis
MAMGRPIVATNIDGVREELRHNETGLLVPPADPIAMAKAILILLDDREKAKHLGREARKEAEEEFSVEKTVRETEKVYLSLLT